MLCARLHTIIYKYHLSVYVWFLMFDIWLQNFCMLVYVLWMMNGFICRVAIWEFMWNWGIFQAYQCILFGCNWRFWELLQVGLFILGISLCFQNTFSALNYLSYLFLDVDNGFNLHMGQLTWDWGSNYLGLSVHFTWLDECLIFHSYC